MQEEPFRIKFKARLVNTGCKDFLIHPMRSLCRRCDERSEEAISSVALKAAICPCCKIALSFLRAMTLTVTNAPWRLRIEVRNDSLFISCHSGLDQKKFIQRICCKLTIDTLDELYVLTDRTT